jgi:hypothetical protein
VSFILSNCGKYIQGEEWALLPIFYVFLPVTAKRNHIKGLERMKLAGRSPARAPDQ